MFKRSDESLIAKALNGDQHAWQQLVNRHQSALFYFGLRLLGSKEDASDLLQDVLMVLCRNLGQYRGDSSFKSWLFGIANYRAMDMLRRRKYSDNDEVLADMPDEATELPEQLANQQQQKQVQHKFHLSLDVWMIFLQMVLTLSHKFAQFMTIMVSKQKS